jgi:thiosulfate reductase cytochrome b subunit
MRKLKQHFSRQNRWVKLGLIVLIAVLAPVGTLSLAQEPSIHPTFPLLDDGGQNVLQSGNPVSTMRTCGACHDTHYIESHSFHTAVGLTELTAPGESSSGRAWDISPGFFGRWNPILYRTLTPAGDDRLDLGAAAWIAELGARHVGGGPATTSRTGIPLTNLPADAPLAETHVLDPQTGEPIKWDWQKSGVVEMNCFLCHTPAPNNTARIEQLAAGNFKWANTATLLGSGIVEQRDNGWVWNPEAFDPSGELQKEFVLMQDPTNENCGQCHGLVHVSANDPLISTGCQPNYWSTETTGQIVSPQKLSDTGMNLANKEDLTRAWDIHAQRVVDCVGCHFSLNNPVTYQESKATQPDHLLYDARRLDFSAYLKQPNHQFARGQSAQGMGTPGLKDTMRRCESCHSLEATHNWLPYKDRHMKAISCESCHIPQMYTAARQMFDWTVISPEGEPQIDCRGIEGEVGTFNALITGYTPVLLPRNEIDGETKLAPYNLISAWYWVYGNSERPVREIDLQAAYLDSAGNYRSDIIAGFDANGNGQIEESELVIDTPAKETLVKENLQALGLDNPCIAAEIQPYNINHTVTNGEWVTKDCAVCHSQESRLTEPILLASYVPGGVLPEFVAGNNVVTNGQLMQQSDGSLAYRPAPQESGLYIMGHHSVPWIDRLGVLALLGTVLGVTMHGGLRFWASLRMPHHTPALKRVYMYTVYERLWHWLQAAAIFLLIFTGLVIHRPDMFSLFQFKYAVLVHNILAAILLVNAFLAAFYHLASGELKQYIPRPRGFFDRAITQAIFYMWGIFKGEPHPFEKRVDKKLNPLQQITYFGILNVLLPLQVITGIMIWGAQRWPEVATQLGGLPFLSPFHSLIAWLFGAFIIAHIYLTTTAHTPLASIKAMIVGWDEVEVHPNPNEAEA